MTDADKELLAGADPETLAEWWCRMNVFQRPEPFAGPDSDFSDEATSSSRGKQIMNAIWDLVGYDFVLLHWNVRYVRRHVIAKATE